MSYSPSGQIAFPRRKELVQKGITYVIPAERVKVASESTFGSPKEESGQNWVHTLFGVIGLTGPIIDLLVRSGCVCFFHRDQAARSGNADPINVETYIKLMSAVPNGVSSGAIGSVDGSTP